MARLQARHWLLLAVALAGMVLAAMHLRACGGREAGSGKAASAKREPFDAGLVEAFPDKLSFIRFQDAVAGTVYLPPVHAKWVTQAEKHVLRVFDRVTCHDEEQGRLVVDVGANDGIFSLLSAARGCDVVAFEVQTSCISLAEAQWRLNGVREKIQLLRRPALDETNIKVLVPPAKGCSGILTVQESAQGKGTVLDSLSVTDALQSHPKAHIAFLKIDIEGGEAKVIAGARPLFEQRRIEMAVVESHHWKKGNARESMRLVGMVFEYGYTITCLYHTAWHRQNPLPAPKSIENREWRSFEEWMGSADELTKPFHGDDRFQCVDLFFKKLSDVEAVHKEISEKLA